MAKLLPQAISTILYPSISKALKTKLILDFGLQQYIGRYIGFI